MCRSGRARQTEEKEKVKTERPVATASAAAAGAAPDGLLFSIQRIDSTCERTNLRMRVEQKKDIYIEKGFAKRN